jgi:hypothetical protein
VKELLGLIAGLIAFPQCFLYCRDILRGRTKPHLFTYLIWTIVTFLVFFGQLSAGAGPGAWTTGISAVLTTFVLELSFKYGTEDVTQSDAIFFALACTSVIPWLLTKDPLISVIIATCIDVCAFMPTIRKTYRDPSSETIHGWWPNLIRHPLAILALSTYSITTTIYPSALFVMNAIVVFVIVSGRRK